ncbi:hypothetical protein IMY05_003G0118400 [Salix suchowensis]|nr:hypothetical protein IMY05_003G0118400 [Salix suchowensis]
MKILNFYMNSHGCLQNDTRISNVTRVLLLLSFRTRKKWIAQRISEVEILTSAV